VPQQLSIFLSKPDRCIGSLPIAFLKAHSRLGDFPFNISYSNITARLQIINFKKPAPAAGHSGFEKVVVGQDKSLETHCFAHYLHHKHFECNYSNGVIQLDK